MPSTPSAEEQLYLELINRLRLNPETEAALLTGANAAAGVQDAINYFGVSISAFQAQMATFGSVAPLAWNGNLADAADFHNQAMIDADEQTHQAPGEPDLGQRVTAAGYTNWNTLGENVFAFATSVAYGHAGFVIDWGYDDEDFDGNVLFPDWQTRGDGIQDPPGHRNSLMNAGFTEIGISVVLENDPGTDVGPQVVTQDLGNRFDYQTQFVGVVINDADGDQFYDIGEGLSGVSILLERQGGGTYNTASWSSGGWQAVVPAGTYTITFSGGGLTAPIITNAVMGSVNVKVDAIAASGGSNTPSEGADTLTGTAGADSIDGLGGNDTISGLDGSDSLLGGGGDDTINGGAGNDTLNGGTGNDTTSGGVGNDFYFVDSFLDVVIEAAGEGSDRIFANSSYAMAAGVHVEILSTTNNAGTTAINLAGNELVNSIAGNNGANTLNGLGGADTLNGLGGNDWFFVDNAGDAVIEYAGGGTADRVLASVSYVLGASAHVEILSTTDNAGTDAINLTGNALGNSIVGNAGNNVLNGGAGADTLNGLGGNDWFYVDSAGDVVVEYAGGGTDRILSSVNYVLAAGVHVEILSTVNNAGTSAINLTGNELANSIVGNAGNNVLNGGTGADTLSGFGGDDWFFVDQFGDAVVEYSSGGSDRIFASSSYAMGAGVHVEILSTTDNAGVGAINLAGNELVNSLAGNAGANVLNGLGGSDTLNGLGGADTYRFSAALGVGNVDTVVGYVVADDTIQLDDAVFTGLAAGALAAGAFRIGATAADADDRIIYNNATGALIFDADGNGAGAAIQFATLSPGLAMSASEFFVI